MGRLPESNSRLAWANGRGRSQAVVGRRRQACPQEVAPDTAAPPVAPLVLPGEFPVSGIWRLPPWLAAGRGDPYPRLSTDRGISRTLLSLGLLNRTSPLWHFPWAPARFSRRCVQPETRPRCWFSIALLFLQPLTQTRFCGLEFFQGVLP